VILVRSFFMLFGIGLLALGHPGGAVVPLLMALLARPRRER
jgi:hypothetical protein